MNAEERRQDVQACAASLVGAWGAYCDRFLDLTRRMRVLFERRDWAGMQRTAERRLDLYGVALDDVLGSLREAAGAHADDRAFWTELRDAFAARAEVRADAELAETFFNSATRRIFHTVGVDPAVEFVGGRDALPERGHPLGVTTTIEAGGSPHDLARRLLDRLRFSVGWEDPERDAARIAEKLRPWAPERLEIARPIFYRGKGAYVVGRLEGGRGPAPFLLALSNPDGKVVAEALLLDENEISIVFSFARSYFAVELEYPRALIDFLQRIMPRKPTAELYNAVGCNRHGKSELFASLLRHLARSDDRFTIAPGQRGMVMCVFTLPGFDVVFKVIRDRFDPPKTTTRREVVEKYRLVFRRDRAGRLVDAQEFEHLEFAKARFEPELLEELLRLASETVEVRGDRVVIRHLYTERRLMPLDLYLKGATREESLEAVIDYGQVLRDLAATNVFPGDMLLKNFGVSRHGRLIFYDYDELTLLTDCVFRDLPEPTTDDEESAGEPWFYVGERDIFPEEFRGFLGLKGELLDTFLTRHGDLLDPAWWRGMQARIRSGEVIDIWPYRAERRLDTRSSKP